jgi:uncharacterized membrane protein YsdA (DUF1294 family)
MPQLAASALYYVLVLMAVMSVFLFVLMGLDKAKARRSARRISEKTLFVLALLGGALGGTAGMFLFRHKTKHWTFRLGFPLLAAAQLALCLWMYIKQ